MDLTSFLTSLLPSEESDETSGQERPSQPSSVENDIVVADQKLAKAALYREFLVGEVFDGDSPAHQEVANEMRQFARQKLGELLGISSLRPLAQTFSAEEVQALKMLAAGVLRVAKKKVQQIDETPPEATPPTSVALPVPPPPAPVQKRGYLKKKKTPDLAKMPLRVEKNGPHSEGENATAPPVSSVQPKARSAPASTSGNLPYQDGSVYAGTDGRNYKNRWIPAYPDSFGENDRTVMLNAKVGEPIVLSSGIRVIRDTPNSWHKIVSMQLADTHRTEHSHRPLSPAEMETFTLMFSADAVKQLPSSMAEMKQQSDDIGESTRG